MRWKSSSKKRSRPRAREQPRPAATELTRRDDEGRVSLVLQTDPTSGRDTWRLRGLLFAKAWQNVLAESAANITARTFEPTPTLDGAVRVAREAMAALSGMCEGWLSEDRDGAVACKEGCSHCCHQPVSVTPPEALAIIEHLHATRAPEKVRALKQRVEDRITAVQGLSRAQQYSGEYPCVFLEGGSCSIYDARPLVCRGMNSLDSSECERRMHDQALRKEFFRQGGGLCFLEPIEGAHAMSTGIQLGLDEVFGLDMRPLALTEALYIFFSDPTMSQQWIKGTDLPHDTDADGTKLHQPPR